MSEPVFSWTVHCNPGLAAINAAKRATIVRRKGKSIPSTRPSDKAKAFKARASEALKIARVRDPHAWLNVDSLPQMRIEVTAYWPRCRHLPDTGELAFGDVDAPLKAVLDAMETAGLYDDDCRAVELLARKRYDKDNPRIEVSVFRLDTHG